MGAENAEELSHKSGTRAKLCGPKHSELLECTGKQVGDKPEFTRAESPECSGTSAKSRVQSVLGDQWETSGDRWETCLTQRI